MSTRPLRSTAGRNRRKRLPLDPGQLQRAQDFARRVLVGAGKILPDADVPPAVANAGDAQFYATGTIADSDLEYTITVWVTRRRDSLAPDLLP